jgi:S-DNA-T family DNA segregation ATPase FtsK/SpoIIIE
MLLTHGRGVHASEGGHVAAARRHRPLTDELLGIMMGGGGVFLLLSLLSWEHIVAAPGRPALPAANWGGLSGHLLAGMLAPAFGSGSVLLSALLWQAALLWIIHAPPRDRLLTAAGGLLLLLGSSPLLHLSFATDPLFGGSAGGLLGRFCVVTLRPYCNVGGTLLLGAVLATIGAVVLVRPLWPVVTHSVAMIRRCWVRLAIPLIPPVSGKHRGTSGRRRLPVTVTTGGEPTCVTADRLPQIRPAREALSGVSRLAVDPPDAEPAPPLSAGPQATAAYTSPSLTLLNAASHGKRPGRGVDLCEQAQRLQAKLRDFGIDGHVVQVLPGPVVTMYEFEPASGIKVSRIVNLADDLALGMKALSVRIVAPIPGKAVVGIEIPNPHREAVCLGDILASPAFQQAASTLVMALGKDILGTPTVTDLAQIPHLLIAGATGSGKSVGLNSMICSILLHASPDDVKFIMIDPKMLELSVYDGIPHLIAPVVTHPKQAAAALHWAVTEMERRYRLLAEHGVRGIDGYNQAHAGPRLPYIVVVIDELADLMLVARREVEDSLTRLAQMARAAGIHLLVATQRPSVDVLTGIIKANFPARISFQVSSRIDSRTILDAIGAERLLGKGDMLFLPPGTSKLLRIHGAYVSEAEIKRVVDNLRTQQAPVYDLSIFAAPSEETAAADDYDDKYDAAVALVARLGQASASLMQRHLRIGYNRAARLIEAMEREGVVGPADGSRPREVYVKELPAEPLHEGWRRA